MYDSSLFCVRDNSVHVSHVDVIKVNCLIQVGVAILHLQS